MLKPRHAEDVTAYLAGHGHLSLRQTDVQWPRTDYGSASTNLSLHQCQRPPNSVSSSTAPITVSHLQNTTLQKYRKS